MTISVSAILTTYQRADLAKRALHSIFGQTWTPEEIIVVEDAGESDLEDWIADLGRDDIKFIRHESNKGLAAARNTGLHLAFIALVTNEFDVVPPKSRWLTDTPTCIRTIGALRPSRSSSYLYETVSR